MAVTVQQFKQIGQDLAREFGFNFDWDTFVEDDEAGFDLLRDDHDGAFDSYLSVHADWVTDSVTIRHHGAKGFGSGSSTKGLHYDMPDTAQALKTLMQRGLNEMIRKNRMISDKTAADEALRNKLIRIAFENPELREELLPLIKR